MSRHPDYLHLSPVHVLALYIHLLAPGVQALGDPDLELALARSLARNVRQGKGARIVLTIRTHRRLVESLKAMIDTRADVGARSLLAYLREELPRAEARERDRQRTKRFSQGDWTE